MRGRAPTVGVKTLPYDEWARLNDVRATVAKIDVHGAEGMVLAGMPRALRNDLRHVVLEVHAPGMLLGCEHRELVAMLADAGFSIYELSDFRTAPLALAKLEGERLRRFVDPRGWTLKELTLMRMLLATKDDPDEALALAA
jgi:hypothetical protein